MGRAMPVAEAVERIPRSRALELLRLTRPHDWIKNSFVFVGVLFSHAWGDASLMAAAAAAAIAFTLVSSAVYVTNDIADREQDRLHPVKRGRPLAAGTVSVTAAVILSAFLFGGGLVFALLASPLVLLFVAIYALMNLAYSAGLKKVIILDVFIISAGFMLRILAGTAGIDIEPSQWLLLTGFMLTLFLGLTKRRAEVRQLAEAKVAHRSVLAGYNRDLLDKMMSVTAAVAIMSYSLYTMSEDTIAVQGTPNLIYTVPFVMYGIFRYSFLLDHKKGGGDPSRELLRDRQMIAVVALWMLVTLWLIS